MSCSCSCGIKGILVQFSSASIHSHESDSTGTTQSVAEPCWSSRAVPALLFCQDADAGSKVCCRRLVILPARKVHPHAATPHTCTKMTSPSLSHISAERFRVSHLCARDLALSCRWNRFDKEASEIHSSMRVPVGRERCGDVFGVNLHLCSSELQLPPPAMFCSTSAGLLQTKGRACPESSARRTSWRPTHGTRPGAAEAAESSPNF